MFVQVGMQGHQEYNESLNHQGCDLATTTLQS